MTRYDDHDRVWWGGLFKPRTGLAVSIGLTAGIVILWALAGTTAAVVALVLAAFVWGVLND